jgi:hypothetical protein
MQRGTIDELSTFTEVIIDKKSTNPSITKSVRVLSVLARAVDTLDMEMWVEVNRL